MEEPPARSAWAAFALLGGGVPKPKPEGVRAWRGDRGDWGSWAMPSRKGSAMMRVESKSGNISGPSVLITSVTSRERVARVSRSLWSVLAEVGLRERRRGRMDLKMSMPVSPKRRAANVIEGKIIQPTIKTIHSGTHSGT